MYAFFAEWLNLLVRWVHVIAAIMWIGDSFLFMWLDSHLTAPSRPREGDVAGELWMTHSGGFYEVVKRRSFAQGEMPATLYWFKWESYTTWLTGFLLLVIVFHLNGASLLIDPSVHPLTPVQATAISLGLLPLCYGLYELLWRTPLARNNRVFAAVGLVLITGLAYVLTQLFSARGAFLQMGAILGTIMSANVFFRIIPAQRHMLAMTREGRPVDTSYGVRAKGRSIQNHYMTLPVLFTMLSNHFPSTYGSSPRGGGADAARGGPRARAARGRAGGGVRGGGLGDSDPVRHVPCGASVEPDVHRAAAGRGAGHAGHPPHPRGAHLRAHGGHPDDAAGERHGHDGGGARAGGGVVHPGREGAPGGEDASARRARGERARRGMISSRSSMASRPASLQPRAPSFPYPVA
jgi:hypothetical protein